MFESLQTQSAFSSVGPSRKALWHEHQNVRGGSTVLGNSSALPRWLACLDSSLCRIPGPRLAMRVSGPPTWATCFCEELDQPHRSTATRGWFVAGVSFLPSVLDEYTKAEIRTNMVSTVSALARKKGTGYRRPTVLTPSPSRRPHHPGRIA